MIEEKEQHFRRLVEILGVRRSAECLTAIGVIGVLWLGRMGAA